MPATNTPLAADVGARFKAAREAAGLSQAALAEILEVREGDLYRWEHGKNLPQAHRLPAIAAALGVTLDALFGIEPAKRSR